MHKVKNSFRLLESNGRGKIRRLTFEMAAVTLRERISERSPVENVILGAFTLIDLTPSYQSCGWKESGLDG